MAGVQSGAQAGERQAAWVERRRSALLSILGCAQQRLMLKEHHHVAERLDLPVHRVALVSVQAASRTSCNICGTEVKIVAMPDAKP
jgi:hypothetical protein